MKLAWDGTVREAIEEYAVLTKDGNKKLKNIVGLEHLKTKKLNALEGVRDSSKQYFVMYRAALSPQMRKMTTNVKSNGQKIQMTVGQIAEKKTADISDKHIEAVKRKNGSFSEKSEQVMLDHSISKQKQQYVEREDTFSLDNDDVLDID